jgi:hypothetical protein
MAGRYATACDEVASINSPARASSPCAEGNVCVKWSSLEKAASQSAWTEPSSGANRVRCPSPNSARCRRARTADVVPYCLVREPDSRDDADRADETRAADHRRSRGFVLRSLCLEPGTDHICLEQSRLEQSRGHSGDRIAACWRASGLSQLQAASCTGNSRPGAGLVGGDASNTRQQRGSLMNDPGDLALVSYFAIDVQNGHCASADHW